MKKEMPFNKEDYFKMLDNMLGMPTKPVSIIERLRQAAQRRRGITPKLPKI